MKKTILLILIMIFSIACAMQVNAQSKFDKHHKKDQGQQHTAKSRMQRMQMQLQQVHYHEEQEIRAEKAQRKAEREGLSGE